MKAKDFDAQFDRGEDVTQTLDLSKAHRPGQQPRRVNVDFPEWMIGSLDKEAKRLGVTRHHQSLDCRSPRKGSGIASMRTKRCTAAAKWFASFQGVGRGDR